MSGAEKVILRKFLIEKLPDTLAPADEHLQIFENYIEGTRLRLRSVRRPSNDERRWYFEQRESVRAGTMAINRLRLDRSEYEALKPLKGREIRKNRYETTIGGTGFEIDVFLGDLWGLNTAQVRFAALADAEAFSPPAFCLLEITNNPAFDPDFLVDKQFEDVKREFAKAKGGS